MKLQDVLYWDRDQCTSWLSLYDYEIPDTEVGLGSILTHIQDCIKDDHPYLLEEKYFTDEAKAERAAVNLLLELTDRKLVLLADQYREFFLVPVCTPHAMVDYTVRDGLGEWNTRTRHFWSLAEAVEFFNNAVEKGWKNV